MPKAYKALLTEYSLTQEEIATTLGKSRSAVANSLRLLDLPDEISVLLRDGSLSAGHCRALLGLRDKSNIGALAARVIARNLSVRETESAVKALNRKKPDTEHDDGISVNYVAELERRVTGLCGRYCKIAAKGARKTVTVEYSDEKDLEELLSTLCGRSIADE